MTGVPPSPSGQCTPYDLNCTSNGTLSNSCVNSRPVMNPRVAQSTGYIEIFKTFQRL